MAVKNLSFQLNNGCDMPLIGLGTYQIRGRELIYKVVEAGLKAGYRSIDTACVYKNETDIGLALKELLPKYNLERRDIFLTSKLAPYDHDRVTKSVEDSLHNLGTTYLDLYLIHWPGVAGLPAESPDNAIIRFETWRELAELQQQGRLRAIGVSNYTVKHLQQVLESASGVRPAVNQVELHPHYRQAQLLSLCRKQGILLQAYSSLGGTSDKTLLRDRTVQTVAASVGRSPAQVLLRWAVQQGVGVIPKSVTPERIAENLDLNFELPAGEMEALNRIGTVRKYAWDPEVVL